MAEDDDISPALLAQLEQDPAFRELLLRQHVERAALSARHAQEYVRHVLAWRVRQERSDV